MQTRIYIITILLSMLTAGSIVAQPDRQVAEDQQKNKQAAPYKIETEFTGQVREGLDSVFRAILVIDPDQLQGLQRVVLENPDGRQETIALSTNAQSRDDGKLSIPLGEYSYSRPLPGVSLEDAGGNNIQVYKRQLVEQDLPNENKE